LHRVYGQQPQRVDGELVEGVFRVCRSHASIVLKDDGPNPSLRVCNRALSI
jgi:hypothetical protein